MFSQGLTDLPSRCQPARYIWDRHSHARGRESMYEGEEGRKNEGERSKITEACKFSLPEVKGRSLEVAGRVGRFVGPQVR